MPSTEQTWHFFPYNAYQVKHTYSAYSTLLHFPSQGSSQSSQQNQDGKTYAGPELMVRSQQVRRCHPLRVRRADGAVRKKPHKQSWSSPPSSFPPANKNHGIQEHGSAHTVAAGDERRPFLFPLNKQAFICFKRQRVREEGIRTR